MCLLKLGLGNRLSVTAHNHLSCLQVEESISFKKPSTKTVNIGTVGSEETWQYCVMDTDRVLGFALGAMFVEEAFQGDSKKKAKMNFIIKELENGSTILEIAKLANRDH